MRWVRILLGAGFGVWVVTSSAHAEVRIGAAAALTGPNSWFGEQNERGFAMAVAEINEAGGLLGERIELIVADDYCDAEQGVAAARKLIADGVVFVAGHACSGPAIPASALYQEAGIAAWQRARLPLVYAGDRLVYAAGLGVDGSILIDAAPDGGAIEMRWEPVP